MEAYLVSFPGCLLLPFLDCICDLWTTWRSGRRPGTTATSSNRKVDSIMTYVDSVSVIMAMYQNSHWLKAAQKNSATPPVYSYDTEDSTLDACWAGIWVVRHTLDLPLNTQAYEVLAMKLLWLPITTVQQGNPYLMPLVVRCGTVKPTVTH